MYSVYLIELFMVAHQKRKKQKAALSGLQCCPGVCEHSTKPSKSTKFVAEDVQVGSRPTPKAILS